MTIQELGQRWVREFHCAEWTDVTIGFAIGPPALGCPVEPIRFWMCLKMYGDGSRCRHFVRHTPGSRVGGLHVRDWRRPA